MSLDLLLHVFDLGVEGAQDGHLRPHRGRVGGAHHGRLAQLFGAQGSLDRRGLLVDVAAAGQFERRDDLTNAQPARRGRIGYGAQQLQRIRGGQVAERGQRSRGELRSPERSRSRCLVRSQISVLCARVTTLIASAWTLSPATGSS